MYVLGISAFYHDSGCSLLRDDEIVASAQEERFTRKKHDLSFPSNAMKFCLKYSGVSISELTAVVFYDKPLLKLGRLMATYCAFAPVGFNSFSLAMPVWVKEKLFLKNLILRELNKIENIDRKKVKLLFPEHHLSHAASAFYPSPFQEAAVLTIDGVGEWATASICRGKDNGISILRELDFPHSVGLLYAAFTYYCGFKVNSGEYKLMGLAPYGNSNSARYKNYVKLIEENLLDIADDGSIWLNQEYFDYATGLRMTQNDNWQKLFGLPVRKPETELKQEYCDLALAIQHITEEIVFKMAKEAKRLTGSNNLCLAGGVALNCVANGKLLKSGLFDKAWVQPAAGDAGGALGAAYAAYYIYFNKPRSTDGTKDKMRGSLLGPEFSKLDIESIAQKYRAEYEYYENFDELCGKVADLLNSGKVVGWFQGRMEWGPRALGNRSILADARNIEMQKKLNLKIKYRESFRPFAPSVLSEDVRQYFDTDGSSPYMLFIADVAESIRNRLPDNYHDLPIKEKLYHIRSSVPAVTHLDYSARLQTVHKETNPKFWKLINSFKERTGCGVIVNTSFNVRGEPIVCTPEDAYRCFMKTEMDYLVMENFLFNKEKLPVWRDKRDRNNPATERARRKNDTSPRDNEIYPLGR